MAMSDLLLRDVRVVPLDGEPAPPGGPPVDVLLGRGVVSAVGHDLDAAPGTPVVDGGWTAW